MRHSSWNSISAWLRVLTNISVVRWRLMSSYISPSAWRAEWPAQGRRSAVSSMVTTGAAPPSAHDEIGGRHAAGRLGHEIAAQVAGLGDGRGKADGGGSRREAVEPRQAEREQVAALGRHQRMQLVEHDAPEGAEQIGRVGGREQQRQLLRRGQQDVGRIAALAHALRLPECRRCASRCGRPSPSPRPAGRDCGRRRPPAP